MALSQFCNVALNNGWLLWYFWKKSGFDDKFSGEGQRGSLVNSAILTYMDNLNEFSALRGVKRINYAVPASLVGKFGESWF